MLRLPKATKFIAIILGASVLFGAQVANAEGRPIRDAIRERLAERRAQRDGTDTAAELAQYSVEFQGRTRSYYAYIPQSVQGQSNIPAIMVFHGGEGNGSNVAATIDMASKAEAGGFALIYPNSPGVQWNDGRSTTRSGIDDVAFIQSLVGHVQTAHGINSNRIFAAGISNGGMFTQRLACDIPSTFSGYAIAAATLPAGLAQSCQPSRTAPMIFFNGTADRLMPFEGGDIASMRALGVGVGGTVLSQAQTMAFWTGAAGCSADTGARALPDRVTDGTEVSLRQYTSCRNNASMAFYIINGGGHNWPGTDARVSRFSGIVSEEIDATDEIIRFFSQYGL
ncbi:MAG: hypothetical protein JKX69_00580 [Rhodobacteraceae bacterium]|nr:hypothetical protein [Paracoccaceae bacterium]